jgi:hypothetical protein
MPGEAQGRGLGVRRAVQQRVFHRRAVVDERTGLTNRLQALMNLIAAVEGGLGAGLRA